MFITLNLILYSFRFRVLVILDKIDTRTESLRKEAIKLQEQKDDLTVTIDMLKNNQFIAELSDSEREEINFHLKRISDRLQTVDLKVQTVRDNGQVDSLHHINILIDEVITISDPISKRQKCQGYLAACSSSDFQYSITTESLMFVDKKFENCLLGCTLDDQKKIRKRLEALLVYMTQQIISH